MRINHTDERRPWPAQGRWAEGHGDTAARRPGLHAALVLALLAISGGCAPEAGRAGGPDGTGAYRGSPLPEPLPRPDFTLTDTEGRPFSFRDRTEGHPTLLFFGYTWCPDICPVHMANIGQVLEEMPGALARRFRVVFVTTDPERDTPERLREWLGRFHRSFIGLRGSIEEVNAIQASLGLPPSFRGEPGPDGFYEVGHAAAVIAFAPDGPARLRYPFGTRQSDWAHDLPLLAGGDVGGGADTAEPAGGLVPAGTPGVTGVTRAVLAEPAPGSPAALYLVVVNPGPRDDAIVSVEVRGATGATLHRTVEGDGGGGMEPAGPVGLPARGRVSMAPGGLHVMVTGLDPLPIAGASVSGALRLRSGGTLSFDARVVAYEELDRLLGGRGS